MQGQARWGTTMHGTVRGSRRGVVCSAKSWFGRNLASQGAAPPWPVTDWLRTVPSGRARTGNIRVRPVKVRQARVSQAVACQGKSGHGYRGGVIPGVAGCVQARQGGHGKSGSGHAWFCTARRIMVSQAQAHGKELTVWSGIACSGAAWPGSYRKAEGTRRGAAS